MLAYVFWHRKQPVVARDLYEARLRDFLQALRDAPPEGWHASFSSRVHAPWIPEGAEAWEDWHLLETSAALDALNAAAVSGVRHRPHDSIAAMALAGQAGLYRLRLGRVSGSPPAVSYWWSKPAGLSYTAHDALIEPLTRTGAALWMRNMVLGPTPEFCLHATDTVRLPEPIQPVIVEHHALAP